MTKEQQELVGRVLSYVNKARVVMHLPELLDLPKGERLDAEQCPIAKALLHEQDTVLMLGGEVNFEDSELAEAVAQVWEQKIDDNDYEVVTAPECFIDFVCLFDEGRLPEYDLDWQIKDEIDY